eukprot:CAMPEP_0172318824 /NCGR_PEP_ID=MMETSP1058-20130122/35916_1 /TAXON_ID=83371 /ORGANISM="Detonula confervacea, Strain CCMP 353" /LENGTH=101 /DNA_ID=CAMNT_0013033729 /DNA_START=37 /DNA_END=342 /DNA_ORIENTATION=-
MQRGIQLILILLISIMQHHHCGGCHHGSGGHHNGCGHRGGHGGYYHSGGCHSGNDYGEPCYKSDNGNYEPERNVSDEDLEKLVSTLTKKVAAMEKNDLNQD